MPISTISQAGLDAPISLTSPTLTTPNINSAQVPTVSGTAPLYMCRAWVNFAGTTGTIRNSGNVTSVTRAGTGLYTVNFTTALANANYAVSASAGSGGSVAGLSVASYQAVPTTSACTLLGLSTGGVVTDYTYVSAMFIGS